MSDYMPPPPPPPYGGPPPPPPPPGGPYQGGPYQGAPYPGGPPGPPPKRNLLPWILGCGGCGVLVLIVVVVLGGIGFLASKAERTAVGDTTAAAAEANTVAYVASEESLNPTLREHFVPFSFRYPEGWAVVERGDSADGRNFVKVERSNGGTTAENFAVGYMFATPGNESDPELIAQLMSQFEQQFASQFPGFRRVSDDRLTLGGRQATGFRFTAKVQSPQHGAMDVFGRVLVVPVGDGRGLSVIMLGTPVQSGLESVDDLGEKGGLPVILRSFRIGEPGTGEPAAAASSRTGGAKPIEGKPGSAVSGEAAPGDDGGEGQLREIRPLDPDSTY